ncbi:MAG TPA: hypothetical protein VKA66_04035 [Mycobacterium sp.]|nr:hypothetical protein [Mycobacterium sp.]
MRGGLLCVTPSAATTESIDEVWHRLDDVVVGGMFVSPVSSVKPSALLEGAAAAMMMESEEVVPVVDAEHLVGLLSWNRVMAASVGEAP